MVVMFWWFNFKEIFYVFIIWVNSGFEGFFKLVILISLMMNYCIKAGFGGCYFTRYRQVASLNIFLHFQQWCVLLFPHMAENGWFRWDFSSQWASEDKKLGNWNFMGMAQLTVLWLGLKLLSTCFYFALCGELLFL